MVELAGALSTRVVSVARAGVAVLASRGRPVGGVLCRRLPADSEARRRPRPGLLPLQGAAQRLHPQLPRTTQLPLPGKSLFSFSHNVPVMYATYIVKCNTFNSMLYAVLFYLFLFS